jgi:hypothetical protein
MGVTVRRPSRLAGLREWYRSPMSEKNCVPKFIWHPARTFIVCRHNDVVCAVSAIPEWERAAQPSLSRQKHVHSIDCASISPSHAYSESKAACCVHWSIPFLQVAWKTESCVHCFIACLQCMQDRLLLTCSVETGGEAQSYLDQ